ncbi:MAG: hypothetical protein JNL21_15385 [Myxococcales bacterium]|nr:hypothetical protein [Myxococcales bacterium]
MGASALGVAACGDDSGSGGSGGSTTTTGSTTTGGSPTTTTGGTTTSGTTTGTTTGSTTSSTTGSTTTGGNLTCGAEIATNHPMAHEMTVSAADVQAGVDKTYNIQGASMHPHTVTLTAADFTTLAGGGTVTKTSSSDAMHTHEVTVTCMA